MRQQQFRRVRVVEVNLRLKLCQGRRVGRLVGKLLRAEEILVAAHEVNMFREKAEEAAFVVREFQFLQFLQASTVLRPLQPRVGREVVGEVRLAAVRMVRTGRIAPFPLFHAPFVGQAAAARALHTLQGRQPRVHPACAELGEGIDVDVQVEAVARKQQHVQGHALRHLAREADGVEQVEIHAESARFLVHLEGKVPGIVRKTRVVAPVLVVHHILVEAHDASRQHRVSAAPWERGQGAVGRRGSGRRQCGAVALSVGADAHEAFRSIRPFEHECESLFRLRQSGKAERQPVELRHEFILRRLSQREVGAVGAEGQPFAAFRMGHLPAEQRERVALLHEEGAPEEGHFRVLGIVVVRIGVLQFHHRGLLLEAEALQLEVRSNLQQHRGLLRFPLCPARPAGQGYRQPHEEQDAKSFFVENHCTNIFFRE